MQRPIDKVLSSLKGLREAEAGRQWDARCPAHEDKRASLSVHLSDDGAVLVKCHAGCQTEDVLRSIGLGLRDLFPPREGEAPPGPVRDDNPPPGPRREVAAYDYRDEAGVLLYQVVRYEPKGFAQRRPGPGRQGWVWGLGDSPRVLYRLPELLAADPAHVVFLCEGEKDVDRLAALGLTASTNPGGAGKWRASYTQALKGRRVVVLPDNDDVGRKHAEEVRTALEGTAAAVAILDLPGLPAKGDVSDWIDRGGSAADLLRLVEGALAHQHAPRLEFPDPIPASQLRLLPADVSRWLWRGYLARGEVTLLSALWKSGKTTLLAWLYRVMQNGGDFCGQRVEPCRVLVVAEEPEHRWAERRDALGLGDWLDFQIRPFSGRPRMDAWLRFVDHLDRCQRRSKYDVIVIDTLANTWPVRDENDNAAVQEALMPLHSLQETAALSLVHHQRKGDGTEFQGSRGAGALPAFADTLIELRRYSQNDRQDCRRVLSSIGRDSETPLEVTVELTGNGFVPCGTREEVQRDDLRSIIQGALPGTPPGLTADQISDLVWGDGSKPNRARYLATIREGSERGWWHEQWDGVRGHPRTYFLGGEEAL